MAARVDAEGPAAQPPEVQKTIIASSISVTLGKMATHPLDTVKAQLQVDSARRTVGDRGAAASSSAGALRRVLARSSARSLYQGFSVAVLGALPAGAVYMTTYELLKPSLEARLPGLRFLADFSAGLAAEAISCVLWCPIDVVKERLQVQRDMRGLYDYRGPVDAVRQIVRLEGVFGLYRAYGATLAAFGPQTAINLALYENIERRARALYRDEAPLPPWLTFACASASGLTACVATAPLDLAKLRMQVVRSARAAGAAEQPFNYRHVPDALQQIVAQEGPRALFKGALVRCIVWVPQTAIFLASFKSILARL
mmetsp:Transcript_55110/g.154695  ORF Transcript_55110/g.154695 Transcript_55110/m.154695 type:complete len:313 (-) Transcript_55110:216-1154(-)